MLELKNICFTVTDDDGTTKEILKDVSFNVETDKFVVITGPNGSGKSTLAKLIMGLERPTSGKMILDGVDITNMDITDRANLGIGFAFQQPVRFKGLTVKDLIRFASGKDINTHEACEFLSQVGLCAANYIHRELNDSLSGGEAKRIEIAMLMARQVKLSLFDEPEAGIDLWSFNNLIEVFKKLKKTTKGSVMIISHQERILDIADKIIVVDSGTVKTQGSKEQILPYIFKQEDLCHLVREEV